MENGRGHYFLLFGAELYGHVQIANALKNFPFIQQFTVVSMAW